LYLKIPLIALEQQLPELCDKLSIYIPLADIQNDKFLKLNLLSTKTISIMLDYLPGTFGHHFAN
jgi:hypothetical protein